MNWSELNLHPTPRTLRQFAAAWLVLCLALSVRQFYGHGHSLTSAMFGVLGIVVGGFGLIQPSRVRWLYVGSTILAFPLGWLVSQIALAVMFFLVLTPIAIFFRLRGRDALRRRPTRQCVSYWVSRRQPPEVRSYFRQF